MQLLNQTAPHLSSRETTRTVLGDMLIALAPLVGMAFYYFGTRALLQIGCAMACCWVLDQLCVRLSGRTVNFLDFSPLVTGIILALLLPAAAPYWLVAVGAVFAIVVKQAFGGLGNNLFNPAASALAFLLICFPAQTTAYTQPFARLELWTNEVSAPILENPAVVLHYGGIPTLTPMDLLLGNFPGPMGATNLMVLFACMLFLAVRKALNFRIPLSFTVAAALFAWCFPRFEGISRVDSLVYEILASTVLFVGFFMASDPVTAPRTNMGKYIYGFGCGILVMLFQYYGAYLIGGPFAILLMNSVSLAIDRGLLSLRYGFRKPRLPKHVRIKGFRKPPKTV